MSLNEIMGATSRWPGEDELALKHEVVNFDVPGLARMRCGESAWAKRPRAVVFVTCLWCVAGRRKGHL